MAKPPYLSDAAALARVLVDRAKLSQSYASELARGKREPSLKLATRLERELKIPCRFWCERAEAA
jgi:transcriptional regulator with XRE-family HTH domain